MTEENHALQQAKSQLEYVLGLVSDLRANKGAVFDADDSVYDRIYQHPLEVSVRSGWYRPGSPDNEHTSSEYMILLCTGGPAVRIIGELDEHMSPITARIEYQDWGTPWTNYMLNSDETDAVLEYAGVFYFGE